MRSKGVRRRAGAAVAMVLALVAVRGWAQAGDGAPGLEQLVREAMARDTVLQQRQLEVSNRQRGVAMEVAGKGFALALRLSDPEEEAGLVGVTVDEEGAEFGFGVAAGVTANLPHPFGSVSTTATVTGPADEDPDGETPAWELGPVAVKLSSGVEQPLGSLLGLDATDADDLEASHGVVQARRAVRARARALANAVLDRVAAIIDGEKAERRALFDLEELEAEVVRRREVFEENEDSHSFQSLLFEVEQERRGLETTRLHLREERAALERDTGFSRFGELAEGPVSMPLASDVEFSPDVIDATVGLRVSDLRIREDDNSQWPEVTFGADYDWNEVTFSAGVGFNLIVPIVDGGLRALQRERLASGRTGAELAATVARREFADALIQAERDIRDLEYATWELRERTRLATLRVDEVRESLAAGVVTDADVTRAEVALELLDFDAQLLRARRWRLALALGALIDADPLAALTLP
ncbi:MAG: TolC family protein [Spirochaetaceae bacterium]|nr:TolC family protein [Spirochaetaceae bacterium]